jgi:predicted O-methyltransferase YrrM
MELVDPRVGTYVDSLSGAAVDPLLDELERRVAATRFPAVGPRIGAWIELLTRSVRAQRVFEFGSGFGYSAYWFARALGAGSELHLTDYDQANKELALGYLERSGTKAEVYFHVGDAVDAFAATQGRFDVVLCDANEEVEYPGIWHLCKDRIELGGLYLCDNVLQAGPALNIVTRHEGPGLQGYAEAVDNHNRSVFEDPSFVTSIVPIRDGLTVALRVR